jgi:hypothetical protein
VDELVADGGAWFAVMRSREPVYNPPLRLAGPFNPDSTSIFGQRLLEFLLQTANLRG